MRAAVLALALAAGGLACKPEVQPPAELPRDAAVAPPAPPLLEPTVLLSGVLPPELAETELLRLKCEICHSLQYVTQQRLTRPQWQKTLDKMRRFGAALSDEEASQVVGFAAGNFTRQLAPAAFASVPPPPGALPPP